MDKSRKKSAVLFVCILLVLGMWMMLSVHSQAAETNNDEKQAQTIRVGSFEDTFNYVDKNGVRRGYGYELMQALAGYTEWKFMILKTKKEGDTLGGIVRIVAEGLPAGLGSYITQFEYVRRAILDRVSARTCQPASISQASCRR